MYRGTDAPGYMVVGYMVGYLGGWVPGHGTRACTPPGTRAGPSGPSITVLLVDGRPLSDPVGVLAVLAAEDTGQYTLLAVISGSVMKSASVAKKCHFLKKV